MRVFSGKQMWIWKLDQCSGGDVATIVSTAMKMGLSGLIVKAWNGGTYWPQFGEIIRAAREAGLSVAAWGYSHGRDIPGEVAAMEQAVVAGADGLIIDAEVEYEVSGGASMAQALFREIAASRASIVPIGYTSFGLPDLHPSFPWAVFSAHCHVAMPQVYWADMGRDPAAVLQKSLADLSGYGLPVAPVGQAYSPATADQIAAFGEAAVSAGVTGVSFWSWQHATSNMMNAIGKLEVNELANLITQDANGNLIKPGTAPAWATEAVQEALQLGLISQSHNPMEVPTIGEILQILLNAKNKNINL